MKKRLVHTLILCWVVALASSARTVYRTAELERLATVLRLEGTSVAEGYSHPVAGGITLTVHRQGGVVDHLGCRLFSDELRTAVHSPVLNFLERYFLQLRFPPQTKTASTMMRDDDVHFLVGSTAVISQLTPSDHFSFCYDQRRCEATWSREGRTLLKVLFPVEHQLISGENKIEAENNLKGDVLRTAFMGLADRPTLLDDATYLSKSYSNRVYLVAGMPIISLRHPAESAANMLLSMQAAQDIDITITQANYGFNKSVFTVPLQQWIAFCRNNACELFFGVRDISAQGDVEATVLAVNEQMNYNHVLSVTIPAQVIRQRQGTVEARLYPYVPTHNIAGILAAYRTTK
ncbi:MAG: hypothetical protein J5552_05980 [Prevotella sp.]|nr:hypothetical protein [Prevotella sp.]